jgi:MFS family permease
MMATLVVGPFYLSGSLGLGPARTGLVMSAGPLVVALAGVPAGRLVDRFGAPWVTIAGLMGLAAGSFLLFLLPSAWGVPGYVVPIGVMTLGYALFQTANNTAVMASARADQRGVISGMLSLSRNLGLIIGASVMGAVFAFASGVPEITAAGPEAVATGMRITFALAAILMALGLVVSLRTMAGARIRTPNTSAAASR